MTQQHTTSAQPYWTWRRRIKASALALPLGLVLVSHQLFAQVALGLFIVALLVDLIRFTQPRFNQRYLAANSFTKPKESQRLSGYTLFLLSTAILFWLFPTNVAVVSLSFFIVSDLVAPIIGQRWLTREIINHKTWGGAIGIVLTCLLLGLIMNLLMPLNPLFILTAAIVVALLDLSSFALDDNLLVPLGTAIVLNTLF